MRRTACDGADQTRHLDWDGCWNARDLGGLPTTDGRRIRWAALVRSEHLHQLTGPGWAALVAHGIRTIVDLRSTAETGRNHQYPPPHVATVHVPLEEGLGDDPEFASWEQTGLLGTPLYYELFLRRWPHRATAAVTAVANAAPGGVIVHCAKGCDRTGMVVALLLTLCEVAPEHIVADYALTAERLRSPRTAQLGHYDDHCEIQTVQYPLGYSSPGSALHEFLTTGPANHYLRSGGISDAVSTALRLRLLE